MSTADEEATSRTLADLVASDGASESTYARGLPLHA
jgi:hypothetical protein